MVNEWLGHIHNNVFVDTYTTVDIYENTHLILYNRGHFDNLGTSTVVLMQCPQFRSRVRSHSEV